MSRQIAFFPGHGAPLQGRVTYVRSEHSFWFDAASSSEVVARVGSLGRTSLCIGTLQLEIDIATGSVLFVWGLHPYERWLDGHVVPSGQTAGDVRVQTAPKLEPGISISITEVGQWSTFYDGSSGWVRVMEDPSADDGQRIMIASGTILGLRNNHLSSVWLLPVAESS